MRKSKLLQLQGTILQWTIAWAVIGLVLGVAQLLRTGHVSWIPSLGLAAAAGGLGMGILYTALMLVTEDWRDSLADTPGMTAQLGPQSPLRYRSRSGGRPLGRRLQRSGILYPAGRGHRCHLQLEDCPGGPAGASGCPAQGHEQRKGQDGVMHDLSLQTHRPVISARPEVPILTTKAS